MRTYPCRGGGRTASWGGSRGSRASGARTCGETSSPPPPPYLQDITTNPSDPPRAQRGRLATAATKCPPPASEAEGDYAGGAFVTLTCGGAAARQGRVG